MADLVELPIPHRDIPAALRQWANDIEAGKYGQPDGCVVVLNADRLKVAYYGAGEQGAAGFLLLHAAARVTLLRAMGEK